MNNDSNITDTTPIATVGGYKQQVADWEALVVEVMRIDSVLSAIETIKPEIAVVRTKLPDIPLVDSKSVTTKSNASRVKGTIPTAKPSAPDKTLGDRMLEILEDYPSGIGGAAVRRVLISEGSKTSTNYVYSMLGKLVKRGKIVKNEDAKTYRLKSASEVVADL